MKEINRVVILGANGAMGAGAAEMFAAGGCEVVLLARTVEKAQRGVTAAQEMAKAEAIAKRMRVSTYDADLDAAVAEADLVFEALAEDLDLKKSFFRRVDRVRRPDSIVATVSSGLSIEAMARAGSENFQRHFLGIHLFNPPNAIVGTEVIPHSGTDPALLAAVVELLERRFGRVVVVCRDLPAFAGNRVGFKVLNEVAQAAGEHGVAFLDYLLGPHTGRTMAPLATIDLVGWDVHRAIVDNVYDRIRDEARDSFRLPAYMDSLIARGHLGNKTPARGGFYRKEKEGNRVIQLVLDPPTMSYREAAEVAPRPVPFVEEMRQLNRVGRYREALRALLTATGPEADLARRVILGYVSYALQRVGEVVASARDIDRIMAFGFNWAPPSVLGDLLGIPETISALQRHGLLVPKVLAEARPGVPLFRERFVNRGKFFCG